MAGPEQDQNSAQYQREQAHPGDPGGNASVENGDDADRSDQSQLHANPNLVPPDEVDRVLTPLIRQPGHVLAGDGGGQRDRGTTVEWGFGPNLGQWIDHKPTLVAAGMGKLQVGSVDRHSFHRQQVEIERPRPEPLRPDPPGGFFDRLQLDKDIVGREIAFRQNHGVEKVALRRPPDRSCEIER